VNPTIRDGSGFLAPSTTGTLPVIAGTVVLDGTADLRLRTEGLQVAPYWPDVGNDRPNNAGIFGRGVIGSSPAATSRPGQPVWPLDRKAPLTPYGKLLLIESGVEFGNGDVEYARLGYVRVDSMDQDNEPDGPISIETSDLNSFLKDCGMVFDISFPNGTTMQTIFDRLTWNDPWRGMPGGFDATDIDLDPTFAASPLSGNQTTQRDRFAFLQELVTHRGYIGPWWDGRGKLRVTKPPTLSTPAVLDIGGPNAKATPITRSGRSITRDGVAAIAVVEESGVTTTPARKAVSGNFDGQSATYAYEFGFVTEFSATPLATSQTALDAYAATRRDKIKAVPDQKRVRHIANGAIEPFDVHRVWPKGSTDPYGYTLRQVESTRIPLVPGDEQQTAYSDVRLP
jgi:hypothetical protein